MPITIRLGVRNRDSRLPHPRMPRPWRPVPSMVTCASSQSGAAMIASNTRTMKPRMPIVHMTSGTMGTTKARVRPGISSAIRA